jgi:uncharacterized membrane protein YeaQ/YmgE (transglycosylase-associated protein family)
MDKRTKKALLLSALACPGLGHWMLGQKQRGAVLVAVFAGLVGWFCVRLFLTVIRLYQEMTAMLTMSGDAMPDTASINEMHLSIYVDNWWLIGAILLLWAYGLWDIYPRKGRA